MTSISGEGFQGRENEINGVMPQERVRVRHERSRLLVIELESWLREQRARVSRNSDTGKAIDYSLKRWAALTRFLDDGRLCMSNNAAERELRTVAVGRRNWTFAGSDEGGRRAAAIYTLIATAKLNDVDPQAWLADVLARLPDHPASASMTFCPGIGACRTSPLRLPDRAVQPAHPRGLHRMDTRRVRPRRRWRSAARSRPRRCASGSGAPGLRRQSLDSTGHRRVRMGHGDRTEHLRRPRHQGLGLGAEQEDQVQGGLSGRTGRRHQSLTTALRA